MAENKFLFVRNCGYLSWDRIYFQGCHWSIQFTDIQRERKRVDYGLKLKVSTVDIRIKQSGLKVNHAKVPNSEPL